MGRADPLTYFRYLPVGPLDEAWGLAVTTAGYVKIGPDMPYPPPGHPKGYVFSYDRGRILDEYQLHYIPRGGGTFESEPGEGTAPRRRTVEPGDFFLLFPGRWHRYRPRPATGWDEYWVGFRGHYVDRLVKAGFFVASQPVIRARGDASILDLFTEIFGSMRAERVGFSQVIASMTALMLARLHAARRARAGGGGRAESILREARRKLRDRLDRDVDPEELARELRVSYDWLRRMFPRHTGLPLHQYHLQLRLNKAMELLSGADCSVKEAAVRTGFTDEYYFSRLFKKKTGRSPTAWRRLRRGERKGRRADTGDPATVS